VEGPFFFEEQTMQETILAKSRNIFQQQKHNKRLTWLVMLLIILLFSFIGIGMDYFYFGGFESRFGLPIVSIAVVIVSFVLAFSSLQSGAAAVLASAQATPADPGNEDHRRLMNVVKEMSIASGLPMPQVYIIPDDDPNAFATGKDPQHSYIAVTRGLLNSLERDELQGVIAHEMSHIRYYDIRFMTVVAAFAGAIVLLADIALRGARFGGVSRGGRSNRNNSLGAVFIIIWLITVLLAPLITRLMALMISRKREYMADASAAELTRNPVALANALQKLDNASAPTAAIKRGVAHICVVDPLGRKINEREGFLAEVFATHPPIQKRIMLLKSMAYQKI
jgi:heat shock protein HtpX